MGDAPADANLTEYQLKDRHAFKKALNFSGATVVGLIILTIPVVLIMRDNKKVGIEDQTQEEA